MLWQMLRVDCSNKGVGNEDRPKYKITNFSSEMSLLFRKSFDNTQGPMAIDITDTVWLREQPH